MSMQNAQAASEPSPSRRTLPWIAFALAAIPILVHNTLIQPWTMDDAYIYFRYAENWANGAGIVFNPGVHVEGYTTILWVALLAAGEAVGLNLELFSKGLGLAFTLGALGLVAHAHRFVEELDARTSAFAAVLLGSSGVFAVWSMSGMDAPMVAFFSLAILLCHARAMANPGDNRAAAITGLLAGVATLARPECAVVIAVVGLDRLRSDVTHKRTTVVWMFGAWLLVYAPYFVWRYAYYGHLLPNTFYAKVGSTTAQWMRGLRYVGRFVWACLPFALSALALVLYGSARQPRYVRLLASILGLQLVYVIGVGGDAMPAFRFFAFVMPILALLAAAGLTELARSERRATVVLALFVAFNFGQSSGGHELHERVVGAVVGERGKQIGLWMRAVLPADTKIAVNAAGAVPYFSRLVTIDMLGLNDAHIAHREMPSMGQGLAGHEKGDGAYVLAQRPDYIVFGQAWGQRAPRFVGDREIAHSPEFKRDYVYERYSIPDGQSLEVYRRHDAPKPASNPQRAERRDRHTPG
jgi:arabinofuranosyltransferase